MLMPRPKTTKQKMVKILYSHIFIDYLPTNYAIAKQLRCDRKCPI
ncbi:hypothetical protein PE36_10743 [Moritella sp. PE36]|nr:hypothetical protein PE36_10743 [Moritella sp. PE36]